MQIDYEQFGRATDQWAKRWLYLSNPSSINRCESNAKKKKKKNNSSYSNVTNFISNLE